MSNFEEVSTETLLIDFREAEQWLHDYPQGENRSMIKDTNRRRRRELLDRRVDLDAFKVEPGRRRLYARRGYVIEPVGPRSAVHIGRDTCRVINRFEAKWIREATDKELAENDVCHWCLEDTGRSGVGTEPIVQPQGDSVRTVSGDAFETNRHRHQRGAEAGGDRSRRVSGEAPMPAFRPVVSSPLPSEPDVRIRPHPALHEHWSGLPLAQLPLSVKYPLPSQAAARRCSPATSFHPIVLRTHWTPSPCGRLSRPPW